MFIRAPLPRTVAATWSIALHNRCRPLHDALHDALPRSRELAVQFPRNLPLLRICGSTDFRRQGPRRASPGSHQGSRPWKCNALVDFATRLLIHGSTDLRSYDIAQVRTFSGRSP